MTVVFALTIFVTLTAGMYLAQSRDVFRCVIGLALLAAAANLVLLQAGRLGSARPAVVPIGDTILSDAANPLPQALVLTAIVISFALVCFALVLLLRVIHDTRTDDALALRLAEPLPNDPVKPPTNAAGCDPAWPPSENEP